MSDVNYETKYPKSRERAYIIDVSNNYEGVTVTDLSFETTLLNTYENIHKIEILDTSIRTKEAKPAFNPLDLSQWCLLQRSDGVTGFSFTNEGGTTDTTWDDTVSSFDEILLSTPDYSRYAVFDKTSWVTSLSNASTTTNILVPVFSVGLLPSSDYKFIVHLVSGSPAISIFNDINTISNYNYAIYQEAVSTKISSSPGSKYNGVNIYLRKSSYILYNNMSTPSKPIYLNLNGWRNLDNITEPIFYKHDPNSLIQKYDHGRVVKSFTDDKVNKLSYINVNIYEKNLDNTFSLIKTPAYKINIMLKVYSLDGIYLY